MCVCLCVIEYVRILVLGINLVLFYKELSLECDFKYFYPYLPPKITVPSSNLRDVLISLYCPVAMRQ